jgi:hypothetical protein
MPTDSLFFASSSVDSENAFLRSCPISIWNGIAGMLRWMLRAILAAGTITVAACPMLRSDHRLPTDNHTPATVP